MAPCNDFHFASGDDAGNGSINVCKRGCRSLAAHGCRIGSGVVAYL